jgi:hypothetical protein
MAFSPLAGKPAPNGWGITAVAPGTRGRTKARRARKT